MKNIFKILGFLAVISLFSFPLRGRSAGGDLIRIIPNNPAPNSRVEAKISSFNFDVNRANITWEVAGAVILKGVGKNTVQFKSPEYGKEKKITAYIITADGAQISESIVLRGNDTDLLLEPLTSTPPSYRGRALSVLGSRVRVVAIPYLFKRGALIDSSKLIYDWSLDFKKDINASGAGKNSFTFQLKDYDDYTVILRVSNIANNISFEKSITVSASDFKPKVLFYEEGPLFGPRYERALTNTINMFSDEISLRAEPYFFSEKSLRELNFKWKMNSEVISLGKIPNILNLKAPNPPTGGDGGEGETLVSVSVNNLINVLQFASQNLKIIFDL